VDAQGCQDAAVDSENLGRLAAACVLRLRLRFFRGAGGGEKVLVMVMVMVMVVDEEMGAKCEGYYSTTASTQAKARRP
jgi:hypothetical protein